MLLLPPGFLAVQVCDLGICHHSLSADTAVDKTAEKRFPKCVVGAPWFGVEQVFRTCSGSTLCKSRNESAPKFLQKNPTPNPLDFKNAVEGVRCVSGWQEKGVQVSRGREGLS